MGETKRAFAWKMKRPKSKDPKYATAFEGANKYTRTCAFWRSLVGNGENIFRVFKITTTTTKTFNSAYVST